MHLSSHLSPSLSPDLNICLYTWIFQVYKICAFSTKRQNFYISGRSSISIIYIYIMGVCCLNYLSLHCRLLTYWRASPALRCCNLSCVGPSGQPWFLRRLSGYGYGKIQLPHVHNSKGENDMYIQYLDDEQEELNNSLGLLLSKK